MTILSVPSLVAERSSKEIGGTIVGAVMAEFNFPQHWSGCGGCTVPNDKCLLALNPFRFTVKRLAMPPKFSSKSSFSLGIN